MARTDFKSTLRCARLSVWCDLETKHIPAQYHMPFCIDISEKLTATVQI